MKAKKLFTALLLVGLVASTNTLVFAAEEEPTVEKVKADEIRDLDQRFHKPFYERSEKDVARDQRFKYSIVPKSSLGARENFDGTVGPTSPSDFQLYSDGFGNPVGTNNISFTYFDFGDIIVVHDGSVPWGYYRHAAMWDSDYYNGSLNDDCIWEANVSPTSDVHRAAPSKFRNYDEAVGLQVPAADTNERYNATFYAYQQNGEPYDGDGALTTEDDWYCSKLIWAAYYHEASVDLGTSGFPYPVSLPDDLYNSNETVAFALGS